MPTPAILLILATLLPLAAFVLLMFVGKRLGNPLAGIVGTAFIGASFVLSLVAMMVWLQHDGQDWGYGKLPINVPMRWIPVGSDVHPNGIPSSDRGFLD